MIKGARSRPGADTSCVHGGDACARGFWRRAEAIGRYVGDVILGKRYGGEGGKEVGDDIGRGIAMLALALALVVTLGLTLVRGTA